MHAFTASGIVCALLAIRASAMSNPELAFAWLGLAFLIDGIDGTFARAARVKEVLPQVSGETLDLVIDYVTYVFVPVLILFDADRLSGPAGYVAAAAICMSSLYHFSDARSKAADNSFVGFPAIWNVVVFYILALGLRGAAMGALIALCVALTFVRLKWVHPLRVKAWRPATLAMTAIWTLAAAATLAMGFPASFWPGFVLVAVAVYGVALTAWLGRDVPGR